MISRPSTLGCVRSGQTRGAAGCRAVLARGRSGRRSARQFREAREAAGLEEEAQEQGAEEESKDWQPEEAGAGTSSSVAGEQEGEEGADSECVGGGSGAAAEAGLASAQGWSKLWPRFRPL